MLEENQARKKNNRIYLEKSARDKNVDVQEHTRVKLDKFASIIGNHHCGTWKLDEGSEGFICGVRVYLHEQAGMRDPDRTSQRLLSARGMKSEVARAQQVFQISRFLLQHVFYSVFSAYLSLGIRVTS